MSHEEPPTSAQEREERIRRLVRAYEQQLRQELPSGPQTLEQIERKADEIGQAVKKGIQKKVSQAQGTGYAGVVLACACGKPVRYIADYARCLVTLHGPLCVARAYYHGRACKHGFFPLNSVLQIGARSCSVAVQALVCRFAAFLPFDVAARELRVVCGLDVAASTVRRVAMAVGEQRQHAWTQHDPRQDTPAPENAAPRPCI